MISFDKNNKEIFNPSYTRYNAMVFKYLILTFHLMSKKKRHHHLINFLCSTLFNNKSI